MKLIITKKEAEAIFACIDITNESTNNNILTVSLEDERRLEKINLDNLFIKIYKKVYK